MVRATASGRMLDHALLGGVPLAIEPLQPMYCADQGCVNTLARRSTCATCSTAVAHPWA